MQGATKSRSTGTTIVVVFLVAFGMLVLYAVTGSLLRALSQLRWTETSCELLSADYTEINSSPSLDVRYRYVFNDQDYESTQYALPTNVSRSHTDVRRTLEILKPGNTVPCWIDPSDPRNAVLEREGLGLAFVLIFPAIFFTIAYLYFFTGKKPLSSKDAPRTNMRRELRESSTALGLGRFLFFGTFMAVGIGVTYLFFGHGFLKVREAMSWSEASCRITRSGVSSHTSKDSKGRSSTSYSFDVAYDYTVDGRAYSGNVYSPFLGSSRYEEARALADSLQVGADAPCYFDPSNPFDVMLSREIPAKAWLGLLPLIFTAAGIFGLFVSFGIGQNKKEQRGRGGKTTRKSGSRLGGFITLVLANLVWNGIVFGVGFALWQEMHKSMGVIFPLLILIPFALIGILLLVAIPYSFLQMFNPTLDLDLSSELPQPGENYSVSWRLNGQPSRIRSLEIHIEAVVHRSQERVSSTRRTGTKATVEEKKVVIPVVKTDRSAQFERGSTQVKVPSRDELERQLGPGRIRWKIETKLSIPWYPDAGEVIDLGE